MDAEDNSNIDDLVNSLNRIGKSKDYLALSLTCIRFVLTGKLVPDQGESLEHTTYGDGMTMKISPSGTSVKFNETLPRLIKLCDTLASIAIQAGFASTYLVGLVQAIETASKAIHSGALSDLFPEKNREVAQTAFLMYLHGLSNRIMDLVKQASDKERAARMFLAVDGGDRT